MPLLKIVDPDKAEGKVKEAYDFFNELAGMVPLPIQMLSPSPGLLSNFIDTVKYYNTESKLGFSLLAHIRLLVAQAEDYPYCLTLNTEVLKGLGGLSQAQVDAALEDPGRAALEPKEVELLKFVLKATADPATTTKADIDALHACDWTDQDIYEAVHEGLLMIIRGMAFKAFKMAA